MTSPIISQHQQPAPKNSQSSQQLPVPTKSPSGAVGSYSAKTRKISTPNQNSRDTIRRIFISKRYFDAGAFSTEIGSDINSTMNGYLPRGSAGINPHGVQHREFGRLGLEKRIIRMKNSD
jgi:hypothetical protein